MNPKSLSPQSSRKTKVLALALLLAGFPSARAAETVTLIASATQTTTGTAMDSDSYTLPAGKVAVVESAFASNPTGAILAIVRNGKRIPLTANNRGLTASNDLSTDNSTLPSRIVLAGPLQFEAGVTVPAGTLGAVYSTLLTITVFTQAEYTARAVGTQQAEQASVATNTVAIPADAAGPVSIVMESSQDMISWNAANPGNYGAATLSRFFRLRAVAN